MADRVTGTVKWFNNEKGYGFITGPDGTDVFVHYSAIRGQGHRSLIDGQKVEYVKQPGTKGPQAQDVQPLD